MARARSRSSYMVFWVGLLVCWSLSVACGAAKSNAGVAEKVGAGHAPLAPETIEACAGRASTTANSVKAEPHNAAVDFEFVVLNCARGKALGAYLRTQRDLGQTDLNSKAIELASLRKSIDASPPSEEKEKRLKQWQERSAEIDKQIAQGNRDLVDEQERLMRPILEDAIDQAVGFAQGSGAYAVYEHSDDCRSENPAEGRSRCVAWAQHADQATSDVEWCRSRLDFTAKVVDALDSEPESARRGTP